MGRDDAYATGPIRDICDILSCRASFYTEYFTHATLDFTSCGNKKVLLQFDQLTKILFLGGCGHFSYRTYTLYSTFKTIASSLLTTTFQSSPDALPWSCQPMRIVNHSIQTHKVFKVFVLSFQWCENFVCVFNENAPTLLNATADEQCEQLTGEAGARALAPISEICATLSCRTPSERASFTSYDNTTLDFTTCGSQKASR